MSEKKILDWIDAGNGIIADTGFESNYAIWHDREKGFVSSNLKREHNYHNTLEEAKAYCKKDLKERISALMKLI